MDFVQRDRLLWRTRGLSWDYYFLCRPRIPPLPGWFDLFCKAFPNDATRARERPQWEARGRLHALGAWVPLLAGAALDPTHRDQAGRDIHHLFLYLTQGTEDPGADWPTRLLQALGPLYGALYPIERTGAEGAAAFSRRLEVGGRLPSEIPLGVGPPTREGRLVLPDLHYP